MVNLKTLTSGSFIPIKVEEMKIGKINFVTSRKKNEFRIRNAVLQLVIVLFIIVGLPYSGFLIYKWVNIPINYSCSYPVKLDGYYPNNTKQWRNDSLQSYRQIGLIRCYLKDLADNNQQGLEVISYDGTLDVGNNGNPPLMHYVKDARSGIATVYFYTQSVASQPMADVDGRNQTNIKIQYFDGTIQYLAMIDSNANPTVWRLVYWL